MKKMMVVLVLSSLIFSAFTQETLRFGLFPLNDAKTMMRLFSPLAARLEEATGRDIRIYSAPDKETFQQRTLNNQYDLVWTSNAYYLDAHTGAGWTAILRGIPSFRGIVMVRKDSGIETLEDLRGKKIGGISAISLAGYLFLRNDLADLGMVPERDYEMEFYEMAESIPFRINSGTVDAGVFSEDTLVRSGLLAAIRDNLKVIHSSVAIPQFPLAARPGLDPGLAATIQDALGGVTADSSALGRSLSELNLEGLEAVGDGDYEEFRQLYLKTREYSREEKGL